ncbi:MAG: tetraacyldisaccharide 4'-kinase, partial [Desulfobacterales bacterium]|nr:tetraacyldisaccharide 4'-kinase [Desulfobacterales bacterium]
SPLSGRRVFAFSGVAKNDEFLYTLSGFDCDVAGSLGFPDHHLYTTKDLAGICRQAARLSVDAIVTTEKDYVKIELDTRWPADLVVLGIDISFGDDTKRFHAFIENRINFGTD